LKKKAKYKPDGSFDKWKTHLVPAILPVKNIAPNEKNKEVDQLVVDNLTIANDTNWADTDNDDDVKDT
jgi:hypothetical protein